MARRKASGKTPPRVRPEDSFRPYSWTRDFTRGGSEMHRVPRWCAILQLAILGAVLAAVVVLSLRGLIGTL